MHIYLGRRHGVLRGLFSLNYIDYINGLIYASIVQGFFRIYSVEKGLNAVSRFHIFVAWYTTGLFLRLTQILMRHISATFSHLAILLLLLL